MLEFKVRMYGPGDRDKREMLKDVTSMANQKGGHLIIGMDTDKNGVATQLVGVEGTGHVERVRSSCLVNISRHVVGLDVEDIYLANGNLAIVVRVPASFNAPHMVTFGGHNQFWIRHGRQKAPMTVDEIQGTVERSLESESITERYVADRKRRLRDLIGDQTWLLLTATPVPPRQEMVDVRDPRVRGVLAERRQHRVCPGTVFGFPFERCVPTLQGLRAGYLPRNKEVPDFLELHRNGHLEVAATYARWRSEGAGFIESEWMACCIDEFVELTYRVWQQIGALRPLIIGACILNAHGLWLALRSDLFGDMKQNAFVEGNELDLPHQYIADATQEAERREVVRTLNDRLWNAFGLERCTFFDEQGDWV